MAQTNTLGQASLRKGSSWAVCLTTFPLKYSTPVKESYPLDEHGIVIQTEYHLWLDQVPVGNEDT
jgi:hypothetical protein